MTEKIVPLVFNRVISYTNYMLEVSDGATDDDFFNSLPREDRVKLQKALQIFYDINQKYVKIREKTK